MTCAIWPSAEGRIRHLPGLAAKSWASANCRAGAASPSRIASQLVLVAKIMGMAGAAGAVWAGSDERAMRVARRIRTGQIDINGGTWNMVAPFGGYKHSGHGRENGKYGLEEYLEYKSMQFKAPKA